MAKKIGDKSCQSNFDTRASDFGSFLSNYYCTSMSCIIMALSLIGGKNPTTYLTITQYPMVLKDFFRQPIESLEAEG